MLADHVLLVTHTDGDPVAPVRTAALRIGMGERYDAIVTLSEGVFALLAEPVGKIGQARALVRTAAGDPPPPDSRPADLDRAPLTVAGLQAGPGSALPRRAPDSVQNLTRLDYFD